MIRLRPMRSSEFPAYVAYFVPDYAAEISANYDQDMDSALAKAKKDVEADLEKVYYMEQAVYMIYNPYMR